MEVLQYNRITYKIVEHFPQHSLELLCLEIIPKQAESFFPVCWHRPPSSTVDKFVELENITNYIEIFQKEIIFLGDTDCDLLEANMECGSSVSKYMRDFYDTFAVLNC